MPKVLAHGALGWYDELVFLGIAVLFIVMMGITWFRSRNMEFDDTDLMPQQPHSTQSGDERYELD